jgi:hypothetical protein
MDAFNWAGGDVGQAQVVDWIAFVSGIEGKSRLRFCEGSPMFWSF